MSGTRRKSGELGPYIRGFESALLTAGYTSGATRNMLSVAGQLGRWLAAEGLVLADFDEEKVATFVAARRAAGYRQVQHRGVFVALLDFLRNEGAIAAAAAAVASPTRLESVVLGYRRWLRNERNLAEATALRYENLARRFLRSSDGGGQLIDLAGLRGGQVSSFMLADSGRVSLGSARGRVAELRSLLRYLYLTERIGLDLASCVPPVAGWRDAHLPESVPPVGLIPTRRRWRPPFIYTDDDIAALMRQARTSLGSLLPAATYATLIGLLASAGLRIGEAIRLERGDIDWNGGILLIRKSKFGKTRQVPL
jgi:integrase/recombinase XerD